MSKQSSVDSSVYFGFAAGAASASLAWYLISRRRSQRESLSYKDYYRHNNTWWGNIEDITGRIGELPGMKHRRRHWPWDRKQCRTDGSSSSIETASPSPSFAVSPQQKSDFCIGSIFGLDVGGTLAKLVYFEKRPENVEYSSDRERWYRHSASARAVLLARRGRAPEESGLPVHSPPRKRSLSMSGKVGHSQASNDDLQELSRLRQESVPDNLEVYAQSASLLGFHATDGAGSWQHTATGGQQFTDDGHSSTGLHNSDSNGKSNVRKVQSMLDLNKASANYNEALDRFYNFARRIDSYREGVKDHKLSFYSRKLGGEFHFIRFETRRMTNAMELIRANQLHLNIREMGATGGGAHKYANLWKDELGIEIAKQDELDSLVAGLQFVLASVVGECYTFKPLDENSSISRTNSFQSSEGDFHIGGVSLNEDENFSNNNSQRSSRPAGKDDVGKGDEWWLSKKVQRDAISQASEYPYMLVSIGTGVSILRVDGPRKHVRVSGSTIGGGTYWGLIRLLTDIEDFETVIRLAERGDPSKVDMMVGDIYGEKPEVLQKMGLAPDLVASSFGKLVAKDDPASGLKEEDIARALLLMITINIGQVAYLNAQLHKTSRIYFVGNFLRQNSISQKRLSYAIDYWSKGQTEALFLEHEGYFGALGAFLLSQDIPHDLNHPKSLDEESMTASMHILPKREASEQHSTPLHKRSNTIGSL